jgi:Thioredoxin-like
MKRCIKLLLPLLLAWLITGCASTPRSADNRPQIYDPQANGEQQLATALTQARGDGKRVLLNLGANWCRDSQAMYRLLTAHPEISREVRQYFILLMVDANKRDGPPRNPDLVARFGDPLVRGIPALLILAPDGSLLNNDILERLDDADHRYPERVLAYLRKWGQKLQAPSSKLQKSSKSQAPKRASPEGVMNHRSTQINADQEKAWQGSTNSNEQIENARMPAHFAFFTRLT